MRRTGSLLGTILLAGAAWTLGGHAQDDPAAPQDAATPAWPAPSERALQIGYNGAVTCSLEVSDWKRAKAWYQEVLGFRMQYELADMQWAELYSPVLNVTIGVGGAEDLPAERKGNATLVFGVKDIEHARAALEKAGVVFTGPTQVIPDLVKLAEFHDPDGNALTLFQSLE